MKRLATLSTLLISPTIACWSSDTVPTQTNTSQQLTTLTTASDSVSYDGYLDQQDCATIAGWVAQPSAPDVTLKVNIYFDGVYSKQVTAGNRRPDLAVTGYGELHGFSTTMPASRLDGKEHTLSVKVAGSTKDINWSPKTFVCAAPTATPKPTTTPSPSPSPTAKPSPTATATPLPSPSPTPFATPIPTVSKAGTRVADVIVDHALNIWSLDLTTHQVLRDGNNVGGGYGTRLYWLNDFVYVYGLDNNWWKWADGNGTVVGIRLGPEEPVVDGSTPVPTPTPAPTATPPTPSPTLTPVVGGKDLTVAWDPSPDPTAAGYIILVSTNEHYFEDKDERQVPDGKTNQYNITNLTPNTTYWVAMEAYNAQGGRSSLSNIISATTAPPSVMNRLLNLFKK
jgi:hypothetical protein